MTVPSGGPLTLEALAAESRAHFRHCDEREERHARDTAELKQSVQRVDGKIDALAAERRDEGRRIWERLDRFATDVRGDIARAVGLETAAREAAEEERKSDASESRGRISNWRLALFGAAVSLGVVLVQLLVNWIKG